ncbi:PDPN protein, partial [Tricholaema leucomelas]|nr:PDPN protein [Tricholaema leucomelas]
ASSALEEESATIDFRDRNDTEYEELPTGVSIILIALRSVTNLLQFGQLMTTESALAPDEDSGNSTGYEANTENADGKPSQIFISILLHQSGLETIALVGIIIGIIVAVGILAGIIIAVVRKMSGR